MTLIRTRPGRYCSKDGSAVIMHLPEIDKAKPWVAVWIDLFGVKHRRSVATLAAARKLFR